MEHQSPFSLRPWPRGDKKPKNIEEFVQRVSAERNGFRNVKEADLVEEIKAHAAGAANPDNSQGSPEGDSDSDAEAENDKKEKTAIEARDDFLRNLEAAHQSAMLNLDLVSLLLSKETPNQAGTTLSPTLRELVGIGTLGSSKVHQSNITPAREADDLAVGTGWRVMGTNKMVSSVLEAAERLEKEITLETKYWADVLAVSESGWAVSSIAGKGLGVRFGFAEAAPMYRDSSIARLIRSEDGNARLDHGQAGKGSQRVRATIEVDGKIAGRSRLPGSLPDNSRLEDRVLEARNTIFAQELWYEISRESRTLLSLGVQSDGSEVSYNVNPATKVILCLEDLAEPELPDETNFYDLMAELTIQGLSIFLMAAHRQNYSKRVQPKHGRNNPPYNLLRPLISRYRFTLDYDKLIGFTGSLIDSLHAAGFDSADFTKTQPSLSLQPPTRADTDHHVMTQAEMLMLNTINFQQFSADITITPEARIGLRAKAFLSLDATQFKIALPGPQNPLANLYTSSDTYPNVGEAIHYVRQATIRAVVDRLLELTSEKLAKEDIGWSDAMDGVALVDTLDRELTIGTDGTQLVAKTKNQRRIWSVGTSSQANLEEFVLSYFKSNEDTQ
ncbi:hypothetical protein PG997_009613 [Apiospora hydei]|uniref:Mediator of RNA polymerase II transcription subunit 17 n=1 Tax=Apiospora hydei TaxID=1337664 RepID=A0ABR1VUM1_9PEZI